MKMLSVILFGVMNTFGESKSVQYGKYPSTTTTEPDDMCYDTMYNNPCTYKNIKVRGQFYFPSCSSCCKFIQCDESGNAFDMPCAPGTSWDPVAYTCNHKNEHCKDECTKYTTTQKPTKYTPPQKPQKPQEPQEPQTPKGGQYQTVPPTKIPDYKCYDIETNNPCNKAHTSKHGFYFKSCDSCCNFIQCDEFGNSWEMPCPAGTFWDQKYHTCNHNKGQCNEQCGIPKYTPAPTKPQKYYQQQQQQQQNPQEPQKPQEPKEPKVIYTTQKPTTTTTKYQQQQQNPQEPQKPQKPQEPKYPVPSKGNNGCYDAMYNNPCSEENVKAGNLYWESCSSCCNFIQCDVINIGEAYDMPCGQGTYWDQNAYTCNYNEGQCNEQCGYNKQY